MIHQRIIFLAKKNDTVGLECVHKCLDLMCMESNPQPSTECLFLCLQGTNYSSIDKQYGTTNWVSVEELQKRLKEGPAILESDLSSLDAEKDKTTDLASILHDACDSHSYLGSSLHLVLILDEDDVDCPQSFVPLAGAFLRLRHWHNARFTYLKTGSDLTQLALQLQKMTQGVISTACDSVKFFCPCWEGKVSLMDRVEEGGCEFIGYYLEHEDWGHFLKHKMPEQQIMPGNTKGKNMKKKVQADPSNAVFGRSIEVLQEVDLRTLPWVILDEFVLKLKVFDGSETTLNEYMMEMKHTGLLARLRLYSLNPDRNEIPTCGDLSFLSTSAWKDRILRDCQNITEPTERSVFGDYQFVYFVLLPGLDNSIVAKVILSPHEVNKEVVELIQDHQTFSDGTHCGKESVWEGPVFGHVPIFQTETFHQLLKDLHYVDNLEQAENKENLESAKQEKRNQILQQAGEGCIGLEEYMAQHKNDILNYNQVDWIPEASLDLSLMPEKRRLESRDKCAKKLSRYQSMDSQPAASPIVPHREEKNSAPGHFTVDDVLSIVRKEDVNLCPLPGAEKLVGRNLCRIDSQCDLKTPWPDSQSMRYHDIYFYTTEEDMKFERRYARVRDKGHFEDTGSSFFSPLKKRKPKIDLLGPVSSPTRSSPRRQALLMSRSKSELSSRSSVRYAGQMDSLLFKQPKARPYSKSPRKKQSPLSTPEPSDMTRLIKKPFNSATLSASHLVRRSPRKRDRDSRLIEHSQDNTPSSQPLSQNSTFERRLSSSETFPTQRSTTSSMNIAGSNSGLRKRLALSSDFGSEGEEVQSLHTRLHSQHLGEPSVRRSPRKRDRTDKDNPEMPTASPCSDNSTANSSRQSVGSGALSSQSELSKKEKLKKRSERHKMKLKDIIVKALKEKDIGEDHVLHGACAKNVYNVSMVLLKTLPNSQNLKEEMKNVVYSQVQQIINLEKRRCGISI